MWRFFIIRYVAVYVIVHYVAVYVIIHYVAVYVIVRYVSVYVIIHFVAVCYYTFCGGLCCCTLCGGLCYCTLCGGFCYYTLCGGFFIICYVTAYVIVHYVTVYVFIHYVTAYVAKYLILQHGVRIPSFPRPQSNSLSLPSFCAMFMNYKCCFSLPTVIGWRSCQLRTTDSHDFTPKSVKLRHDVISYRTSLPSTVRVLPVSYTRVDINPYYSKRIINSR